MENEKLHKLNVFIWQGLHAGFLSTQDSVILQKLFTPISVLIIKFNL